MNTQATAADLFGEEHPTHQLCQTVEAIATMIEQLPSEALAMLLDRLGVTAIATDAELTELFPDEQGGVS